MSSRDPGALSIGAELTNLRLERDGYCQKYAKALADVASLEAQLDEATDKVSDLKHSLQRVLGKPTGGHIGNSKSVTQVHSFSLPAQVSLGFTVCHGTNRSLQHLLIWLLSRRHTVEPPQRHRKRMMMTMRLTIPAALHRRKRLR